MAAPLDAGCDLSGRWIGRFAFPRLFDPISFNVTLDDRDGWLSGRIDELAHRGLQMGRTITATLQGRRDGASVAFLKIYDQLGGGYDSVRYEGTIGAGGDEIAGRWLIAGNWSGSFIMIRAAQDERAVRRSSAVTV